MTEAEGLWYRCAFCPWQGRSGLMDHIAAVHPTTTGGHVAQQIRGDDPTSREALSIAQQALLAASRWLQGEYAKGPETPGAKVQVAVNDALAEVNRVLFGSED